MTDSTTFGSGMNAPLDLSPPGQADAAPPDTSSPAPATPTSFGSGLRMPSFGIGPSYTAPDPQSSALDQTADTLQQRVRRANEIASNPILQFFNPEGVQKARDFVPQAAEKLQQIRVQQAAIKAGREQATSLGLAPGEAPDEATYADRIAIAQAGALKGDLKKFQGIQAIDPKAAEAIQDQVHEAVGTHLTNAQYAYDSLAGMTSAGQYDAKVAELRKSGKISDLEGLGLKVPKSFDEFNASKAREGQALREARIGLDTMRNKLEARTTFQPMEDKEQKAYQGYWKTVYGDDIPGIPSRNAASGARALVVPNMADPRTVGPLATPEQRKGLKEDFAAAVPKEDMEKYRANTRLYGMATTINGQAIPSEGLSDGKGGKRYINDNPNVQQGIAEGLASALRGGLGGATAGLLNIETSKRGAVQSTLDKLVGAYGGAVNTLKGEQVKPYLTQLTQKQQRDVLDYIKSYNDKDIGERTIDLAHRAGALRLDSQVFGFTKGESAGAVDDAIKEGRTAQVAADMARHQAIGGGDGVLQIGAQRPGVGATSLPPGTASTTQLPGASPIATPVQQAQQPAVSPPINPQQSPGGGNGPPLAPVNSAPQGPGGGPVAPVQPQPVTVAGQPVSVPLPAGASPNFIPALQRIETGKSKDPWTASADNGPDGKPISSASGVFQMIDRTWNDNKPAGAPNRAKDATPQQQADAFAALTAKNAHTLAANDLPVNDTNLYITHNLGGRSGYKLLSADPNADARTVVGDAAANNNPKFFRGKPTVATVLQRYQTEVAAGASDEPGPKPQPGSGGAAAEAPGLMARISRLLSQGVPGGDAAKDKAVADIGSAAVEHAPAIGSTLGAVGGSVAGPAGTIGGGAAGGGAGQALKDYLQGNKQSPSKIAEEAALGGVLGVASEARPVVAAAGRVLGAGGIGAGAEAARGGDTADVVEAGAKGGAYGLGGEALGRFISALGPAAHKLFSKFTPDAQAELSAQAGKLVEARKVLSSEEPKLAGEGAGPNPKYEAAKKMEDEASQYIKDHGQKPDDMAYAYEQTKAGTSAGEAATLRKANAEKSEVSSGYDQLREDVSAARPNDRNIKPNQALPDGPISTIRTPENPTGKVPEVFRPDAEHAEMLVKAPAKNWGDKWQQLQDAGSELIKKRMDFIASGDRTSATAMNEIFKGVRNQQKAVATRLFGEKQGGQVIAHLENLDQRYAKVMNATAGMNYQKMKDIVQGGNTPARRELEANFKEFAKDDPSAIRAFNAMKAGAKGRMGEEAKLMIPVIAGEFAANAGGIPTVGLISAAIGGHRLVSLMKEYMNAKLLGKPVSFKDFAVNAVKSYQHGAMNAAGTAAQRGATM